MADPQLIADQVKPLIPRYMEDNSWFRFYTNGTSFTSMTPDDFADAAGRAFCHANEHTQMLLLGDTKLRSDQELISNFGLNDAEDATARSASSTSASAPAPGSPPPPGLPRVLSLSRVPSIQPAASASATSAGGIGAASSSTSSGPPGSTTDDVSGILSNSKWSPMLNDAFILGGIQGHKQFTFAPVGEDKRFFQSMAAGAAAGAGASKEQRVNAAIPAWMQFFRAKSYLLWDNGFPRVFARELLGLASFGYQAVPTDIDLSFTLSDKGKADTSTFDLYLTELKSTYRFQAPDKEKILKGCARFLFGEQHMDAFASVISAR